MERLKTVGRLGYLPAELRPAAQEAFKLAVFPWTFGDGKDGSPAEDIPLAKLMDGLYALRGRRSYMWEKIAPDALPKIYEAFGLDFDAPILGDEWRPAEQKQTLANFFCWQNNHVGLEAVLGKTDLGQKDGSGRTLLEMCCAYGAPKCARLLLKKGADPDVLGSEGQNMLMAACQSGSDAIIEMLATAESCAQTDECGRDALMYLCHMGRAQMKSLALVLGLSDPRRRDADGDTALHLACRHGGMKPPAKAGAARAPWSRGDGQYYFDALLDASDLQARNLKGRLPEDDAAEWLSGVAGDPAGYIRALRIAREESAELETSARAPSRGRAPGRKI